MNEPPDPGGSVPPAVNFVTIEGDESGMDTDISVSSITKSRKRSYSQKICKQCNKKKRKHLGNQKDIGCACKEVTVIDFDKIDAPTHNPQTEPTTNNTSTSIQLGRRLFNQTDSSPYTIHIQRLQSSQSDGTTLHPISLGKILKQNKINNIINGSIKRIGRNRIAMAFSNFTDANEFLNNSLLNQNNLKAFIPSFSITRVGIVKGVPIEWSTDEILENISTPFGCGKIIKVRRINYKVMVEGAPVWKPTQSVVVYFDGQILPKRIYMCFNSLPVNLYIFPTIQCFNCCRFGHTKVQCRSKPRCFRCGQEHTGETCKLDDDDVRCCLCSGSHIAISKVCPELKRQRDIKTHMAQNCVSYAEATKFFPPVSKSFSEVLMSTNTDNVSIPATHTQNNSYKKTVFIKPRTPPPRSKGYDQTAHSNIINEFSLPTQSNGCALLHRERKESSMHQSESLIAEIMNLLNTLTESNTKSNTNTPNNVAPILLLISKLLLSIQNGSPKLNPVELQKCNQQ